MASRACQGHWHARLAIGVRLCMTEKCRAQRCATCARLSHARYFRPEDWKFEGDRFLDYQFVPKLLSVRVIRRSATTNSLRVLVPWELSFYDKRNNYSRYYRTQVLLSMNKQHHEATMHTTKMMNAPIDSCWMVLMVPTKRRLKPSIRHSPNDAI